MKILIIRTIAIEENLSQITYNNQGIGLATALSKLGHKCTLVYYAQKGNGKEETFISDGEKLKVYHIEGKNLIWNAIYNNKIYELCKENDLIQVSECDQICSWQVYKKFPQKTVIYHGPYASKFTWKYNLRSSLFDKIFTWRVGFKNATVITKSYLAEDYLRKKGFKNITTLGVGLNPYLLDQNVDEIPGNINKLLQEKDNSKYLLYIGKISVRKNVMFLLKILNELIYARGHKNYKLIIVGGKDCKEEKYFDRCFKYIRNNNLLENVIYLGTLEQKYLKYLYQKSDLYLLATQYDIFGMVYLEALYFGIPILTTECGGSSLLIREGETGFIRKIGETKEWCDIAEEILENPDQLRTMRERGTLLIKNVYLWEKKVPEFLHIYEGLLNYDEEKKHCSGRL